MGNPTVAPLQEWWHNGGFMVSEAPGHQSRDQILLTGGQMVLAGTVLGQISTSNSSPAATAAAGAANVGNGTLTIGTQPQTGFTPAGVFTVTLTAPTVFSVTGPNNFNNVDQPVGTAFDADGMVFTVTAGSKAFAAGDSFSITVTSPGTAGQWRPLNPTASDGSQVAAGVLFASKDVTAGPKPALGVVRLAEVNGSELIWPAGITPIQQAAAVSQLAQAHILVR
ncbi:head decoration protein [Chromobacterium haemolyticum]|uniref:head decoration protein n=1 Tax=Chromobacterium haemolyticum TaxID=394935 RepID=UPI0009DE23CC|nr:head decoration protein [Chromobacterium haemolyticum]